MSVSYGGDSIVFADGSVQSGGWTGFKNRIINGGMVIDQRNAGASTTVTSNGYYSCDRWTTYSSQSSKYSVQQNAGSVTPPVGFSNYIGITSLSSYSITSTDYFSLLQQIEGYNIADFAWGTASAIPVTLSFWVRSSLTGTFGGALRGGSGANRSYPFTYTISSANTWEQKSITIAGDTTSTWTTNNGSGLIIYFGLGVGSTYSGTAGSWQSSGLNSATGATSVVGTNGATFYITGVQLERGSTASSFEYRPYGAELQLCQRYYEIVASQGVYIDNGSADNARFYIPFKVTKRATPTMTSGTGNSEGGQAWTPGFGTSSIEGTVCATGFTATARPYINPPIVASAEL
jgi:hypothetical protein